MLSAQALGVIGGFNVLGSLFFGWAAGAGTPLVTGWIGETFGLTWLAMLGGVVLGLAAGLVQGATPGGAAVRRCRSARVEHQPPRRPDA